MTVRLHWETHGVVWAKARRGTGELHPLICHLIDVAEAALSLWSYALPPAFRQATARQVCLDVDAAGRAWAFWAGCHDLGKASPGFQRKVEPARARLVRLGFPFPPELVDQPCYHAAITASSLGSLLIEQTGADPLVARDVAQALGGHHGLWPHALEIESQRGHTGSGPWDTLRRELVSFLAGLYLPPAVTRLNCLASPTTDRDAMRDHNALLALFSGFVSVADWIGSDEAFFPFADLPTSLSTYQQTARAQAMRALAHHGWLNTLAPPIVQTFEAMFEYTPNTMQAKAAEIAMSSMPSLVIVEAPTGSGKTEAALYLADAWHRQRTQRGFYIAMPTMATSNQMHRRAAAFVQRRHPGVAIEPLLVHSMAQWQRPEPTPHLNSTDERTEERGDTPDAAWFMQRKRSLLAPCGVGTVDQTLLGVLQTRHFFVRLLGLSHKTVIFDEVHAYDAYMSTLFERLLGWLRAVDATVVILTATLPRATRERLLRAWGDAGEQPLPPITYPSISWSDGYTVQSAPIAGVAGRTMHLGRVERDPAAIAARLRSLLGTNGASGHAAVVCNTVARAQEVYLALKDAQIVPDDDLILFHARYPFAWRERIEQRILDNYAKGAQQGSSCSIVVATQVIEQSLDIDFDLMISDLCPIDLLIQRAGRLHRHNRPRPAALAEPHLLVAQTLGDDGAPLFGTDAFVYDEAVLLRSWLALDERTTLTSPDDTSGLIDWVYSDEPPPLLDNTLRARLARAEQKMRGTSDKDRYEAAQRLVPPPQTKRLLQQGSLGLAEDDPGVHATLQALTRLGPPTVSIVCLHDVAGSLNTEPDGSGVVIDLKRAPTHAEVVALARAVVSVQRREVVQFMQAGGERPRPWRDHALLSTHFVAVFRDGLCSPPGARFRLRLERALGLVVEKEEG